jgi:hypothetical protein
MYAPPCARAFERVYFEMGAIDTYPFIVYSTVMTV